ncbi:MAG: hypothetical protein AVDCRST_MAG91-195 [uncultured Sphingomonadaceae bacterium]|uniref:Uncharacterized protein n=1 Tax=uncultured Sphingomonadaceae bacterium TaxID=169976 RepID=A0A6J4RYE4_9SPHN|nr:MAG: hypothetical protein AVDCRST_MAG91-195 [uncultured Sphingomonadaceae bacterium]
MTAFRTGAAFAYAKAIFPLGDTESFLTRLAFFMTHRV